MTYIPLNYSDLFSVKKILKSRGFEVSKANVLQSGFILKNFNTRSCYLDGSPGTHNSDGNLLYEIFNNSTYRKELLSFIENKNFQASEMVSRLTKHERFNCDRNAYSTTFEWYVGELMIREFAAFSSSVGVEVSKVSRSSAFKDTTGDYDVITVLRNMGLAYFECKTGDFNQEKILKAVERALALHVDFVIMAIDNSINERILKSKLENANFPLNNIAYLEKISLKNSSVTVYRWSNCYFINTSTNISEQICTVLRIIDADRISTSISFGTTSETYDELGYKVEKLKTYEKA